MYRYIIIFFIAGTQLTACSAPTPQITPELINVNVSSAAYPWIGGFYKCASVTSVINLSDPQSADITLRLGEPDKLTTPAYQISKEDILVVAHTQSGVSSLNLDQVKSLFLGQTLNWKDVGGNDDPVQVWAYSPNEDVQGIFSNTIMNGQPVTSLARLAGSAQNMLKSVETSPGSIGILPRHLLSAAVEELYTVATVPVIAITKKPPQGSVKELIGCLQADH